MKILAFMLIILIIMGLQIFLSMQKNKWLGIIIPIINTLSAILFALNATKISAAVVAFVVMSIPTVINLTIYFICRNKLKKKTMMK